MADTARFRSQTRYGYSRALLALTELARRHDGPEFSFGPLSLDGLEQQGLVLSGEDITSPLALLRADVLLTEAEA